MTDKEKLLELLESIPHAQRLYPDLYVDMLIENGVKIDAVSRDVHNGVCAQFMWERDMAISQLEEHGIPFGGIAPDVVEVVRCKDCKYARESEDAYDWDGKTALCECGYSKMVNRWHEYCSWGKRKVD